MSLEVNTAEMSNSPSSSESSTPLAASTVTTAESTTTNPSKSRSMEEIRNEINAEVKNESTGVAGSPDPLKEEGADQAASKEKPVTDQEQSAQDQKKKEPRAEARYQKLVAKLKDESGKKQEAEVKLIQMSKQLEVLKELYRTEKERASVLDADALPEVLENRRMKFENSLREKAAEIEREKATYIEGERKRNAEEMESHLHAERVDRFTTEFNSTAVKFGFDRNEVTLFASAVRDDVNAGKDTGLEEIAKSVQSAMMERYTKPILEKHSVALNAPRPLSAQGAIKPAAKPRTMDEIRKSIFDELEAAKGY